MTARSARNGSRYFCSCSLILIFALIGAYLLLRGMGAFLVTGDPLKQVDAVVPLGGGSEHRVVDAVKLIEQQYANWLILTEPGEIEPGKGLGSKVYQQEAVDNGLSPYAIIITEQVARSTYEEATSVRQLMEVRGFKSIIVVTDPFHTQRSRMIFREVFKDSDLTVRVHPASNTSYRSDTWFLSLSGWGNTIREYAKLAGYLVGIDRLQDDQ